MLVFLVSCCSTEEQALMGVFLDAQEEKIRAYCVAKDWDLIRVIRDDSLVSKTLSSALKLPTANAHTILTGSLRASALIQSFTVAPDIVSNISENPAS
jgi:hypothetical protein